MTHANANTSKAGRTFLPESHGSIIKPEFPDNPLLVQNVLIGQQMGQVPLFCTASSWSQILLELLKMNEKVSTT